MNRLACFLLAALIFIGCSSHGGQTTPGRDAGPPPPPMTFQQVSDAALATLQNVFYHDGNWELCVPTVCGIGLLPYDDFDWGSDSMTAALYVRWTVSGDASIPPMMAQLDANASTYGSCTASGCASWSDVPLWDSIAASHEHFVLGTDNTLKRAQGAFDYVDTATEFGLGACPTIDFQIPRNDNDPLDTGVPVLKTLETDSNYVKAALLLYQITSSATYLAKAKAKYASIRQYFLDPTVPLYTVYVLDDGTTCAQVPRRFYASVNGNMIWNGMALAAATGTSSYLDDAIATAKAVAQNLSDASGVFADLQTEDDVVEPLIEAMYLMATKQSQSFASGWLQANALAMAGAQASYGAYGRFFDGPAPQGPITAWQANGGIALAFVAGAMWPDQIGTTNAGAWQGAVGVPDDLSTLPSSIQFTGQAIAVFGTLGETSSRQGEASVLVDGIETFDQTGVHQNQTEDFGTVPNAVLFAWRWPSSGPHTISFQAGPPDPKDGGPFLHVQSYSYIP